MELMNIEQSIERTNQQREFLKQAMTVGATEEQRRKIIHDINNMNPVEIAAQVIHLEGVKFNHSVSRQTKQVENTQICM